MFEYDNQKSLSNLEKHGISFLEIQRLWSDELYVNLRARSTDEDRFMAIGKIDKKLWSVIYTLRNGNIRIISARRSRKTEIEIYEST